jgi:hypothetical protein
MSLGSVSHRAGTAFFEAALVTVLAIVSLPLAAGAIGRFSATLQPFVVAIRLASAPLAFAAGGAVAGRSLERGRRGVVAALAASLAAGIVLAWPLATLQGLTGFEPMLPLIVVPVVSFGLAFGLDGAMLAWQLAGVREARRVAAWSAAGGVTGALLLVLPSLLARTRVRSDLDVVWAFIEVACSSASVLVPFTVVGWSAGSSLERGPLHR